MNKLLLLAFIAPLFFSCKNLSPKETAEEFITALANADLTTATSLASADTKALLDKAKKDVTSAQDPKDVFEFSSFAQTVNEKKAEVKNGVLTVPLVKEEDGWKVVLNEMLLNEIQSRDALLTMAKAKWSDLLREYQGRQQVLNDYVNYKKGMGALSPNVSALSEALNNLKVPAEWTRETLIAYTQKQQQLNKVIDEALEPSSAASADLSVSYIVQISNAGDRIRQAEVFYQPVADKAHSPVFVPLPFLETKSVRR